MFMIAHGVKLSSYFIFSDAVPPKTGYHSCCPRSLLLKDSLVSILHKGSIINVENVHFTDLNAFFAKKLKG